MTEHREIDTRPDIRLAGLEIWVHNRQFPDSEDYWDGNWLYVTAHCWASGASVWVSGSIVHSSEVAHLLAGAQSLYANVKGKAELPCMEPELSLELEGTGLGHINMTVRISPENLTQNHEFRFEIDQSYLPELMKQCKDVLERYPIKGKL